MDMGGFISSVYKEESILFISQQLYSGIVDASIGGKTGIKYWSI